MSCMITECELYIHCWLILAFFVRLLWSADDSVVANTVGPGSTRNGAAAAAAIRHIGLRLSHRHNLPILSHGSCVVTHSALPALAGLCCSSRHRVCQPASVVPCRHCAGEQAEKPASLALKVQGRSDSSRSRMCSCRFVQQPPLYILPSHNTTIK